MAVLNNYLVIYYRSNNNVFIIGVATLFNVAIIGNIGCISRLNIICIIMFIANPTQYQHWNGLFVLVQEL